MSDSSSSNKFDAQEFFSDVFGSLHLLQDEGGTIWFIGREVVDKLGYSGVNNAGRAIINFVQKEDRKALKYKDFSATEKPILWTNPNDFKDKWIINECGFYDLLMHSGTKQACEFQHWVTHEVLPSIRKNGGYIIGQEHLEEDERQSLMHQINELADEVEILRNRLRKKNEKMRTVKREAEINRLCRSKYKEALNDIDKMTKLFEIEDKYNEYLRQRDVDRDITMQTLRKQFYDLRVLVMAHGATELVNAAIRDGIIHETMMKSNALTPGPSDVKQSRGTNCFLN